MYADEATGLDGLEQLFLSLLRQPESDDQGCLLTNAAVEFGAQRSVASDSICRGFALLEVAIRRIVEREVRAGRAEIIVARLLILYQGILVLIRAGRAPSACADVIRTEFAQLRESKE